MIKIDKSTTDLSEFTTPELLEWFNANSNMEPVKRFSDRASAERRVFAVLGTSPTPATEPKKEVKPAKVPTPKEAKPAKAPRVPKEKKEKVTPAQRAEAVKVSWSNDKVRAARSARHNVRVDGTLHNSVLQAFKALKLDVKPHQRVRRDLVANGTVTHEGHKFVLVPKED